MEAKMPTPTPTPSSSTSLSLCPPPESYFVFVVGHCEEWPEGRDEQGDTAIYTSYLDFGVPADQCKYIKDNDCTRKNCQKQLESFLQKTEKLSESREREHQKQQKGQQHNRTVPNTLVFYYGGHGSANGFATIGGTWAYKQVARTIEECFHGDRVLFLIDCCASGNLWQHLPSASVSTSTTGITAAAASKNVNKKTKEYALLTTSQPYITSTADGEEWILTNSWIQLMRRRRTVDNDDEDKDDLSLDEVISLLADRHVFETGDLFFAYVVGKTRLLPLWETNPGTKKQKSGDDSWSWMPSRSRWRAKIREDAANENKKESTSSLSSSSLAWLSSSESLLPSASKDLPQVPKEAAILSVHDCRVGDALAYKHPGGYPTSLRESKHKRTFYVPPLWLHGRIVSVFETDGDEEEASIIGQHNDNDANNHYCDGNATDIIFRIRVWYPSQQKPWEVEVSHRSRRLVNQFFVAQNWMLPKAFCKTQVVMAQKYRQYLDCSVAAHTPIRVQVRVALGSTNGDGSDGHSSNGNKNKNIREGRVLDWKDFHWKELLCYYNDSDSCSATFPGKTKYDEYYWNELPVPIKIAALDLGYTESHWDEDINIPADGMNWQELTEAQKEAATVLGYVRQKPAAGDLSVTLSGKTNYDDYNWNELPAVIQVAALAFGYTESHWDESIDIPADGMDWQELTEAQKEAAAVLGYVREKPAASDSNGSHDGTIYFSQTVCEISTSAGPHVPVVWNDNHQSSLVPLKQIVFAGIKRSPSDILAPKSIQKMTVASSSSLATNDSDGNEELERLRRQSLVEALKSSGKSIGNAESIFGTTKLSAFWPDTEEFYDATPIDIKGKDNNSSGYESSLKLLATHFECPVPGVYCPIVYEDGVRYLVPVNHIYRRGCQPQLQDRGDDESTVSNTDESITTTALSMIPTKDSSDKQINAETSSNQPRSCSTPNKSYVDEYWEDLPEHVQKAAQYVGYKKKLWDLDGNIPIDGQKWKDLNSDQREALEIIGYHEATWSSQNDNKDISSTTTKPISTIPTKDSIDETTMSLRDVILKVSSFGENFSEVASKLEEASRLLQASFETTKTGIENYQSSTPNKSYVDEYWEDLPKHVQKAAQHVGYNEKLWDSDGNIPIDGQEWKDLNSDQRETLEIIGYHEATWNSQNDDTRAQGCIISLARTRPDAFESLDAHGGGKKSLPVPRKVAFHYGDATVTANRAGIFLRKRGICSGDCQPPVDVTSKVTRHHHTYITIGLPRLPLEPTTPETYLRSVQALLEIFRLLWAVDSDIVLYVFPTKARKNPAARAVRPRSWSNSTPDRTTLEIYSNQVWLRGGLRPFLRFYVGHNIDPDTLFSPAVHEQADSRDCQLRVDIIQAAKVVVCGFLVGSYMKTFNIDRYNAFLSMVPKFAACPVAVIKKNIVVTPGERNAPRVPAAHVQCDASKLNTTVGILKAMFNRGRATDVANLPDGRVFKFCESYSKWAKPDIVRKCRIMQKQFLGAHTSAIIHGVTDLDHAVDLGEPVGLKSLREILLGMKTRAQRFWPLFVAIDYDTFSDEIYAVVHLDLIAEATTVLTYLPVYLQAKFGTATWQWFSSECRKEMSDYTWHKDEHRVVSLKATDTNSPVQPITNAFFAAWENVDDADVEMDQGSFTDPNMLAEAAEDDAPEGGAAAQDSVPPVDYIMTSTASVSEITNEVDQSAPKAADQTSVSSAPAALSTGPSADVSNLVASATSKRQTGVSEMNE